VLQRAGDGQLRRLTAVQKQRMEQVKRTGWMLSALIGFVFTLMPCGVENYLVAHDAIAVDGCVNSWSIMSVLCSAFNTGLSHVGPFVFYTHHTHTHTHTHTQNNNNTCKKSVAKLLY
jgi:hypothetical protein